MEEALGIQTQAFVAIKIVPSARSGHLSVVVPELLNNHLTDDC